MKESKVFVFDNQDLLNIVEQYLYKSEKVKVGDYGFISIKIIKGIDGKFTFTFTVYNEDVKPYTKDKKEESAFRKIEVG